MNHIVSTKDIKSKVPPLSVSTTEFLLCGKKFACKSMVFQFRHEVDAFVDTLPGCIAVYDQPGYTRPDVPARDGDKFVLRYAELPHYVELLDRVATRVPHEEWLKDNLIEQIRAAGVQI